MTELHLVAFNIDRMHGRFNLAPGKLISNTSPQSPQS